MAFLDKIGGFAKSVGDKTGGMIETTKIRGKIKTERDAIVGLQRQIGELCWSKFENGVQFDEDIDSLLEQIKAGYERIARLEEEIEEIARANQNAGKVTCKSCGTVNPEGTNFCSTCGIKMEQPSPVENTAGIACANCGTPNPEEAKFCIGCGLKIEAQLTVQTENRIICPNCSADNDEGAKFCVQCGANLDNASENGQPSCVPPAERKLMGMRAFA